MALNQLGKLLAGVGEGIKNNPEAFAIGADMIGQNLDPNNAFAGVGTAFGQSSLANQAAVKQQRETKMFQQQLLDALSGGGQGQAGSGGGGQSPSQSLLGDIDLSKLTAPEEPGDTAVTFKRDKDGRLLTTRQGVAEPGTQARQAKQNPSVNLNDLLPLSVALSGQSPVNLTGLSPEQIATVMGTQLETAQVGNQTIGTLYDSLYRRALADKARTETANVGATNASANQANQALALKRTQEAIAARQEMLRAEDLHPVERQKLQADIEKLQAQQLEALTGANLDQAKTTGENISNENAQLKQQVIQGLLGISDPNDLNVGAQLLAGMDPVSLANNQTTQERLASQHRTDTRLKTETRAFQAQARLEGTSEEEPSTADLVEYHKYAPDEATVAYIWDDGTGAWNLSGYERVQLPSGTTMEDLRYTAKETGMTIPEILTELKKQGKVNF